MGFYTARRLGWVPFGSIYPNQCLACLPACEAPESAWGHMAPAFKGEVMGCIITKWCAIVSASS